METCYYFDGNTAHAHNCTLHLTDDNLYIYFTDEADKTLIWARSGITDFHLNGQQLIIKYGKFPQQTIECNSKQSLELYKTLGSNSITKKTKSVWLSNKATFAIVLCVAFVGICLGAYFVMLPWVAEKAATLIPLSTEIELGNSIAESVLQTNSEEDSASYYANQFISKLNTDTEYPIKITVLQSKEINAFAVPGGRIFVYSGIINELSSYEELTALLGHEISHVTEQHSLKSICRSASSGLFIAALFGDITGISAGILQQADEFQQLNYSRDLETNADDKGFEMMVRNKISPIGMVKLLKVLETQSEEMPQFMKYLSTHPETAERIKNIESKKEVAIDFEKREELTVLFNKIKYHTD